jgi:hypothetical protein
VTETVTGTETGRGRGTEIVITKEIGTGREIGADTEIEIGRGVIVGAEVGERLECIGISRQLVFVPLYQNINIKLPLGTC